MVCSTPPPSTIPETEKPEPEMKKEKKKRVFRRETVADRLLASAKKMAEIIRFRSVFTKILYFGNTKKYFSISLY
ncbi:Protein CBG27652 [Caenorhabditis briggsae]|uniref:Protein CBG27652 n=1 Tax=Caenorhabditis briggsae TaxID=6238 RepID=B6IJ97_CAEBR|nr:Protein CBG27652 [Caenorhabditis briggsae]CAR99931.1 Protein CBG27652 [Caenorhabditis briggsae]